MLMFQPQSDRLGTLRELGHGGEQQDCRASIVPVHAADRLKSCKALVLPRLSARRGGAADYGHRVGKAVNCTRILVHLECSLQPIVLLLLFRESRDNMRDNRSP